MPGIAKLIKVKFANPTFDLSGLGTRGKDSQTDDAFWCKPRTN
jgi:hypothetical protein